MGIDPCNVLRHPTNLQYALSIKRILQALGYGYILQHEAIQHAKATWGLDPAKMASHASCLWSSHDLSQQQHLQMSAANLQRSETTSDRCSSRRRTLSSTGSESSTMAFDRPQQLQISDIKLNTGDSMSLEKPKNKGSTIIESSIQMDDMGNRVVVHKRTFQCWDHGCNGRIFSTLSNYRRHCREKKLLVEGRISCPVCGKRFTRTSARDAHLEREISNIADHTNQNAGMAFQPSSLYPVHCEMPRVPQVWPMGREPKPGNRMLMCWNAASSRFFMALTKTAPTSDGCRSRRGIISQDVYEDRSL